MEGPPKKRKRKSKRKQDSQHPAFFLDDGPDPSLAPQPSSSGSSDESSSDSDGAGSADAVSKLLLNIDEPDEAEESFRLELEAQDRANTSIQADRYFAEEDKTHQCTRCKAYGHSIRDCTHIQCSVCGVLDDHEYFRCPRTAVCRRCGAKGHTEQRCSAKYAENRCSLCGALNHKSAACSLLWRIYEEIAPEDREPASPMLFACYNCGESSVGTGHFGTQCPFPRGHPVRMSFPSAFTHTAPATTSRSHMRWEEPVGGPSTYNEPPSHPAKRPTIVNGVKQPTSKRGRTAAPAESPEPGEAEVEDDTGFFARKPAALPDRSKTAPKIQMPASLASRLGPIADPAVAGPSQIAASSRASASQLAPADSRYSSNYLKVAPVPDDVTKDQVHEFFEEFGQVDQVHRPDGWNGAFVAMHSRTDATTAKDELHQLDPWNQGKGVCQAVFAKNKDILHKMKKFEKQAAEDRDGGIDGEPIASTSKTQTTRSLRLAPLPSVATKAAIQNKFHAYGQIQSVHLLSSRACCFVNFHRWQDAQAAQAALDGQQIFGESHAAVRVSHAAEPTEARRPRGVDRQPHADYDRSIHRGESPQPQPKKRKLGKRERQEKAREQAKPSDYTPDPRDLHPAPVEERSTRSARPTAPVARRPEKRALEVSTALWEDENKNTKQYDHGRRKRARSMAEPRPRYTGGYC